MSQSRRYPPWTSMIISWGHRRLLASSLLSLAMQSSSVFSSWPSISQVKRCCGGSQRRRAQSWYYWLYCVSPYWFIQAYLHSDMNVVWLFVQRFWVLLSLPWYIKSIQSGEAFPWQEIRWVGFEHPNALYIDFPLGLNMPFLCSGAPLMSSGWKGCLCWGKSSDETLLSYKNIFFKCKN